MVGLRAFLAGSGLVVLFGIALYMFAFQFIAVNNPDPITSLDPTLNQSLQSLQARADDLQSLGDSSKALLEAENEPSAIYLFLIVKSAFTIPFAFLSFMLASVGTFGTIIFTGIFGTGSSPFNIILSVALSIALLTAIILIIRAIRTGETER